MRSPEFARQRFEPKYSEGTVTIIDKERCEERMTIGIRLVDLVPRDDGRVYNSASLKTRNFFSQLPLTECQISRTLDHLHSLYPNLEVFHLGLENTSLQRINGVVPFALEISTDYKLGGAVVLSYQGTNPITGTPAIPKLAYEAIDSQGEIDQLIPNWIALPKGQEKIIFYGCSVNPEGKADLVYQSVLTEDRKSAIAAEKPPNRQKINTLSLLFFKRKCVLWEGELDTPSPHVIPDPLTCATDQNCPYFIANAGRIEIPPFVYLEEYDKPKLFWADPSFLVRFHFLTQENAEKTKRNIETRNHA